MMDYEKRPEGLTWACGITTVWERINTTLLRTMESIKVAGFTIDWIFADNAPSATLYHDKYDPVGVTLRYPKISVVGNWILGMIELYIRKPTCDRYVMFQDDIVAIKNLRPYLDTGDYPYNCYLNLYTITENCLSSGDKQGWFASSQLGRGALALVFSRESLQTLFHQEHLFLKPSVDNGHRSIDGAIITAMSQAGWKEYVHNPSLVQHTGTGQTTLGNGNWLEAASFPGENFDALTLLSKPAGKP
jgi:hypothetical protein